MEIITHIKQHEIHIHPVTKILYLLCVFNKMKNELILNNCGNVECIILKT